MLNTANTKNGKFLRVMSVLMIILASVELLIGIIFSFAGTAVTIGGAIEGEALLVGMGIAMIVLSLVSGVLMLVAGINSLHTRRLKMCYIIAIIFFVLILVSFIVNCFSASTSGLDVTSTITNIIELIVLFLYMVSVRKNM